MKDEIFSETISLFTKGDDDFVTATYECKRVTFETGGDVIVESYTILGWCGGSDHYVMPSNQEVVASLLIGRSDNDLIRYAIANADDYFNRAKGEFRAALKKWQADNTPKAVQS